MTKKKPNPKKKGKKKSKTETWRSKKSKLKKVVKKTTSMGLSYGVLGMAESKVKK
jgi:hypothetical protein